MENLRKLINVKKPERDRIKGDTEKFLKNGGKINKVGVGMTRNIIFNDKDHIKKTFKI